MLLNDIVKIVIALWVLFEISLTIFVRARPGTDRLQDRGSVVIVYAGIFAGIGLGALLTGQRWAHINLNFYLLNGLCLVLILGGLALRVWAIFSLGRFFTTNVAVRAGHQVIRQGPYRFMRHPSYTGGLISFFGLGLAFANWLSLAVMFPLVCLGYVYRIRVEEKALIASLGEEYLEYSRHTKRLIPGIY